MPLRQTIGISLALLMASAGAMAKTPEKTASHQPSQPPDAGHQKSANRTEKPRSLPRQAQARSPSRLARYRQARIRYRHAVSYRPDDRGADPGDRYWGATRAVGSAEIGQAAWYDLVGGRTSSGERLDAVTPTAAHRSLPLGSCAKVTDLDTGRSVIVRNQRPRPLPPPLYHRSVAARRRRARDEICRGGGGRRRARRRQPLDNGAGCEHRLVADRGRRVPDRGCQSDAIAPLGPHSEGADTEAMPRAASDIIRDIAELSARR